MRRFLATSLIVSVLLFVTTLAGLSVFGMAPDIEMGAHDCVGTACAPMGDMGHAAADGINCINHCLNAAAVPMAAALPPIAAFMLLFLAVIIAEQIIAVVSIRRCVSRWREGIGKQLLHLRLSTIVLRN